MKVKKNRLILDNGVTIKCNLPIEATAQAGRVFIIITEDPKKNTENENLYAYSDDGTLLWRGPDRSFPGVDVNPYIDAERIDDDHVRVWDYYGAIYTIEARTGNVLEKYWGK